MDFFRKSHMYVHHLIGLNKLINMMHFIFNLIKELYGWLYFAVRIYNYDTLH